MRPAEVLAAFPEPQVYEDWMGGNLNDALLFRGLRLHFSECISSAPLPNSTLNWVVIHQRADAYLFGKPVGEWTKESVLAELRARGYDARTPPNGDVEVPQQVGMSFDDDGRLIWVEVWRRTRCCSGRPRAAAAELVARRRRLSQVQGTCRTLTAITLGFAVGLCVGPVSLLAVNARYVLRDDE